MSGGSHNYLCYVDAKDLFEKERDLKKMSNDLASLGYAKDAARETEELLLILRQFENRLDIRLERLSAVWKAIEWWHSGDTSEEGLKNALEEYRNELLNVPQKGGSDD